MRPLAAAESIAVEYARAAGIEGDDEAVLAALRAMPAQTLWPASTATVLLIVGGPEIPGLAHSILDGRLVVEPPEATLRAGRQAPVPVTVGANDADLAASPAQTKDRLFAAFGPLEPQARKLYDPRATPAVGARPVGHSPTSSWSSRRATSRAVTRAGQTGLVLPFSYVAESQRGRVAGAPHARRSSTPSTPSARSSATRPRPATSPWGSTLSGYWTDFVRTGDPNGGGPARVAALRRGRDRC